MKSSTQRLPLEYDFTPLIPIQGVTDEWLNKMILTGRLFVGQQRDHAELCTAIKKAPAPHLRLVFSR